MSCSDASICSLSDAASRASVTACSSWAKVNESASRSSTRVDRALGHADVVELPPEQRLLVLLVGHDADGPGETSARVDLDLVIGRDDAGAEDDRRHVPLARRAETHDEPHRAVGKIPLVVMRDDRRIEQAPPTRSNTRPSSRIRSATGDCARCPPTCRSSSWPCDSSLRATRRY